MSIRTFLESRDFDLKLHDMMSPSTMSTKRMSWTSCRERLEFPQRKAVGGGGMNEQTLVLEAEPAALGVRIW